MNFEFFFFLIFMSIVSFIVAFLAYGMVVRCLGKEGTASRWAQIILIPACVIFYDFICIASGEDKYLVGTAPLILTGLILLYYYFFKGETFLGDKTPTQAAAAQNVELEPKKFSKKSQRIHEARKKRGGK